MRKAEIFRSVSWFPSSACRDLLRILASALLLLLVCAISVDAQEEKPEAKRWLAGAYSFSDELGGFKIRAIGGTGTREDPIVIEEELVSASPVTMVIRTTKPIRPFDFSGKYANGFIHLKLIIWNGSEQAWIEVEFELQEILGQPSLFGDGLSFDQRRTDSKNIYSDSFADFSRDFEPYDRLLYRNGKVDPRRSASFGFLISDYTPKRQFYLVQDPRIPST
ncbi:hypothetical protein SAMN05518861_108195 [Mesorhizobium sp. YR577]|nr:hypothetical protein SAMN05518861_108195 [Mesorhizobium sp. YR577]